jgi:hypothetical protein
VISTLNFHINIQYEISTSNGLYCARNQKEKKKKKLNGRRGHLAAYVMISIMQIDCLTKGNQQG